jgi:glutathione S-transferase
VTDSTHVRTYVAHKYHLDLDDGLDARQRAESWAIERMMEDHLYWAMVWFRWVDADNFAKGPAHFADRAPEAARAQIREEMQARKIGELHSHGLGRHTPEQIAELGKRSLDALAVLLGDKPYLFGEKPHAADAIAFGVVASVSYAVLRNSVTSGRGKPFESGRLRRTHDASLLPRVRVGSPAAVGCGLNR